MGPSAAREGCRPSAGLGLGQTGSAHTGAPEVPGGCWCQAGCRQGRGLPGAEPQVAPPAPCGRGTAPALSPRLPPQSQGGRLGPGPGGHGLSGWCPCGRAAGGALSGTCDLGARQCCRGWGWVAGTEARRFEAAATSRLRDLFDPLCGCGSSRRAGLAWLWGSLRLVEPWRGVGFREAGGSGSHPLARGPADPPSWNCSAS